LSVGRFLINMVDFIKIRSHPKTFVENKLAGYYPPILDYDAVFAAQSLTKGDVKVVYRNLKDCFSHLGENKYPILENSILYSVENFMWFSTFFKKVEEIYVGADENFQINYDKVPEESKGLMFQTPYYVREIANKDNMHSLAPYTFKLRTNDAVNMYRVLYIKRDLEIDEFYDGFPGWYIMKNTTVFEKYNEKTNVRVRIDFRDGEFYYYVCGASDAWLQIEDVPIEMDDVVSAILFR